MLLQNMADDVDLGVLLCGRAELEWLADRPAAARAAFEEARGLAARVRANAGSELAMSLERLQSLMATPLRRDG